jgi:D-alanyl-D-alanine carboxypeptidase
MNGFEKTEAYEWLQKNAYNYGFVISYTKNNTYYSFEPWHWRFVGKKLAKKLHKTNKYFYKMDQREIYNYLEYFFD